MGFGSNKVAKSFTMKYSLGTFETTKTEMAGGAWPNGAIKYVLKSNNQEYNTLVRLTMDRWEACVKAKFGKQLIAFVEVQNPSALKGIVQVHDTQSSGYGDVGHVSTEELNCKVGTEHTSIIWLPHELGHVIGLAHEHQRPDMPKKVRDKVAGHGVGQMLLDKAQQAYSTHGTEIDWALIMFYSYYAVIQVGSEDKLKNTEDGGCLITKAQIQGKSWHPSKGDLEIIGKLYA